MISCRLERLNCSVVNMAVHSTSEVVPLAFLWTNSRTYRYNLSKFWKLKIDWTGWLHTRKKIYEMKRGLGRGGGGGVFPCHETAELPRIPFGHEGGKRRLVLIK